MYDKSKLLGVSNVATGIALLPNTSNNRVLFVIAAALLVIGAAVFALSLLMTRKGQGKAETK